MRANEWHLRDPEAAASNLKTDLYKGLSEKEALRRQRKNGKNDIWHVQRASATRYALQTVGELTTVLLIITALIAGFMAKESVVSTLEVIFGSTAAIAAILDTKAAISLLIFCLLYTPCVAAIAAVKRELGVKWAAIVIVGQCAIAWLASFIAHAVGVLFTMI